MTEAELENLIEDLVERLCESRPDSAEHKLIERELRGVRYGHYGELAGGLIEKHDPDGWGCYCGPNTTVEHPQGLILPLGISFKECPRLTSHGKA